MFCWKQRPIHTFTRNGSRFHSICQSKVRGCTTSCTICDYSHTLLLTYSIYIHFHSQLFGRFTYVFLRNVIWVLLYCSFPTISCHLAPRKVLFCSTSPKHTYPTHAHTHRSLSTINFPIFWQMIMLCYCGRRKRSDNNQGVGGRRRVRKSQSCFSTHMYKPSTHLHACSYEYCIDLLPQIRVNRFCVSQMYSMGGWDLGWTGNL